MCTRRYGFTARARLLVYAARGRGAAELLFFYIILALGQRSDVKKSNFAFPVVDSSCHSCRKVAATPCSVDSRKPENSYGVRRWSACAVYSTCTQYGLSDCVT